MTDTRTLEVLYNLARAVHDLAPEDRAVLDDLSDLEYELRDQSDPTQLDLRDRLEFYGNVERRATGGGWWKPGA